MSLYFLCDVCLHVFLAEVIQYEHTVSGYNYIDELKSTFICLPHYKILRKIFNLSSVQDNYLAVLCLSCRRDINVIHESVYKTGGQQLMNGGCMHDSVLVIFFYYRYNFQTVVFKFAKLELVHKFIA